MDFAGARNRVRRMIAAKKPQDLSKSALTENALRDNIIGEEASYSERFKGATRNPPVIDFEVEQDDGTKKQESYPWGTFPEMLRDVARMSFDYDEPEIRPAHQVKPSYQLNREIAAELAISESFMESRPYTKGNAMESLFNALAQSKDLKESAKTRLASHIARSEQMAEQEQAIENAEDMMERLRQMARQQIQDNGQVDQQTKRDLKGQVKARQAARELLQSLVQQQAQSSMVTDAIAAANSAAQAGAEAVEAINSLPGIGGGHSHNLTADQQIALAEKWTANTDLKRIAEMLGRMYRDMRFKRETRTKNVAIEPVGVTVGDHLERMLPLEAARAVSDDPLANFTFVRDWSAAHLLEYDMSGKMPAGKGPIICVTDGSGSMSGEPFIWASSLALCLLTLAQREHRDFAGVEFGSRSQMKSWFFPKNTTPDADTVIDYASHFWAGGTSTVTGMAEAARIVSEVPEFKTADIILIGDGQDTYTEEDMGIKALLTDMGVRIHGISIMCPNNRYMAQMCEYVEDVVDLAGSNDATSKVAQNIT